MRICVVSANHTYLVPRFLLAMGGLIVGFRPRSLCMFCNQPLRYRPNSPQDIGGLFCGSWHDRITEFVWCLPSALAWSFHCSHDMISRIAEGRRSFDILPAITRRLVCHMLPRSRKPFWLDPGMMGQLNVHGLCKALLPGLFLAFLTSRVGECCLTLWRSSCNQPLLGLVHPKL